MLRLVRRALGGVTAPHARSLPTWRIPAPSPVRTPAVRPPATSRSPALPDLAPVALGLAANGTPTEHAAQTSPDRRSARMPAGSSAEPFPAPPRPPAAPVVTRKLAAVVSRNPAPASSPPAKPDLTAGDRPRAADRPRTDVERPPTVPAGTPRGRADPASEVSGQSVPREPARPARSGPGSETAARSVVPVPRRHVYLPADQRLTAPLTIPGRLRAADAAGRPAEEPAAASPVRPTRSVPAPPVTTLPTPTRTAPVTRHAVSQNVVHVHIGTIEIQGAPAEPQPALAARLPEPPAVPARGAFDDFVGLRTYAPWRW